jgi:hypothetical protein
VHNAGGDPVQTLAVAQVADDPWQLDVQLGSAPAGAPLPVAATVARDGARVRGAQVTVAFRRRGGATDHATLYDDGAHGDGAAGDGCYAGGTAVAAGDAVVTLAARSGTGERLARTFARVAPGDTRTPACAPGFGRPGEIAYLDRASSWQTTAGALDFVPRAVQDASYSPDGTRLAWSLGDSVYVAGATGDGARRVAGGDDVTREGVAWSPDGTRLAYAVHCQADCGIAVLDLASGAEREIPAAGDEPTWAPTGDRLAFRRLDADEDQAWCVQGNGYCPPAYDLWVVGADGSGLRQLTHGGHGDSDPAWSPAGDRIAFTRWEEYDRERVRVNNAEIYTVAPDGSGLAALTHDPTCTAETSDECQMDDDDEQPAWSPDGRQIVYSSTRGEPWQSEAEGPETSQLWVMRRDGSGAHAVTTGGAYKDAPSWRALPYLTAAAPPECHDVTARTTAGEAVRVTLDCADPNGDVLDLRVLDRPEHGSVGPVGADGAVRYTPAAGYTGEDAFTFAASDGAQDAAPATVHLTVTAPPPPAPTPTPVPSGPIYTGGSSPGGTSSPPGGPIVVPIHGIPGDCVILPDGSCYVGVPCEVIGHNDCVGRALQAPGGQTTRVAVAAAVRKLLRPTSVRIKRGHTGRVRLTLSAYGRSQLRRRGRLTIRVRVELRAGGKLIATSTRTVRFRRHR